MRLKMNKKKYKLPISIEPTHEVINLGDIFRKICTEESLKDVNLEYGAKIDITKLKLKEEYK